MDINRLKKLTENPDFIPGIYNYCDRWCERCQFTSRCMNFALSEEHFDDPDSHDVKNEAFWRKLGEVFQLTRQMIEESAAKWGIDLDSLDLQAAEEEIETRRENAKTHECARASMSYVEKVKSWFESAGDIFRQKEDELNTEAQLDLPGSEPAAEAATIGDAVEVIRWYQYFIHAKLLRAVRGAVEETADPPDEYLRDSDGSAKVALIAMDRSIAAWGRMYEHFPEHQSDILNVLVLLERLRGRTQTSFPNARAFVRPGFDDVAQAD